MAPATVYLETTVLSYLTARDARDEIIAAHQSVTRTWWESQRQQYRLVASAIVLREASAGDPEMAPSAWHSSPIATSFRSQTPWMRSPPSCLPEVSSRQRFRMMPYTLRSRPSAASNIFSLGICGILRERSHVAASSGNFADWGTNHRLFAHPRS
ncbi:MAG: hypothetical protein Q7R30_21720 [Acidobacteriota bacterium]|nr:hypothetical protein [Acidobacteriota bacterium]